MKSFCQVLSNQQHPDPPMSSNWCGLNRNKMVDAMACLSCGLAAEASSSSLCRELWELFPFVVFVVSDTLSSLRTGQKCPACLVMWPAAEASSLPLCRELHKLFPFVVFNVCNTLSSLQCPACVVMQPCGCGIFLVAVRGAAAAPRCPISTTSSHFHSILPV